MNAAQDMIMQMLTVQMKAQRPAAPAKHSSDESSTFGDLLTQKREQMGDAVQESAEAEMQPTDSVPAEEQELTHEQMELLAAMNAGTKTILFVPTEDVQTQQVAPQQTVQLDAAAPTAAVSADVQQTAAQPMQGEPVLEAAAPATQQTLTAEPAAQETAPRSANIAPQQNELGTKSEVTVRSDSTATVQKSVPTDEITYTAPTANAQPTQSDADAKTGTTQKFDLPMTAEQTTETAQEGETVLTTAQRLFTVVEAAPVKVAEAPVVDTTAPTMEADLSKLIADTAQEGKESITIRLAPETLGEIEVRLTRGTDGALQVVMTTASERTQSILEKHAAGLQTMLGANTRGEVEIEVATRQEAQQHSFERDAQHHGGQEQEQKQQHQQQKRSGEDFLQQLRLGLLSLDAQAI